MDFHKLETTHNFVFGPPEASQFKVRDWGDSVFQIQLTGGRWPRGSDSHAQLDPRMFSSRPSQAQLHLGSGGEVDFRWKDEGLLASKPGRGFGVCGSKWVLAFVYHETDRFYGLGQKHLGLELSHQRTKFWNTDEFGDFPFPVIEHGRPDPSYSSYPVLIVKHGGLWAAIVVDNPHGVFINTGANEEIFQPGAAAFLPELYLGSRDGAPDLWFLADENPAGLVRKIQTLQGRVPLPPLWALGHQQCRWGYGSPADLNRIADEYARHEIPNDGLWLDIDYMDGFRVFTLDKKHFQDPLKELAELRARGHRVVPILDPGLRQDPEYGVYAEAKQRALLCQTIEGQDYVGFVWPGYTVFPDFSLPETQEFWKEKVKELTDLGFGGYWIDMNDPSTGSVPHDDMRFGHGTLPHSAYHNQYALGMAAATRAGVLASRPHERPFIVSRSSTLSSSRHTAVWTGDNVSNEHHMKGAITMSLNLSVSGMPFNGPDVPGFALDASNELMRAWYKLGFLFPFLRNHKIKGGAEQEPWTRDEFTTQVVTSFIRARYTLLPYLYQCFVEQADHGDPLLRPLWYHDPAPEFESTDDVFFVGSDLLQAPFTELGAAERAVTLPRHKKGAKWYDVEHAVFTLAGQTTRHRAAEETTPLFFACPALLPLQHGTRVSSANELNRLDLLLLVEEGSDFETAYHYDDGLTVVEEALTTKISFRVRMHLKKLEITAAILKDEAGPIRWRLLVCSEQPPEETLFNGTPLSLMPETLIVAGVPIPVLASIEKRV